MQLAPLKRQGWPLVMAACGRFFCLMSGYFSVRSGREMLWGTLSTESKYKAKGLVDVHVYRSVDALAAQATSGLQSAVVGPVGLALSGAATAALWALNGWWLGKRRDCAEPEALAVRAVSSGA